MNIVVSGINYKKTPLEIREKLSFKNEEIIDFLNIVKSLNRVLECVLLSTCNRTEVYISFDSEKIDISIIEDEFCKFKGLDSYLVKKYFYTYYSSEAVHHILKVASGIDSMILGEDQILGQIKNAFDIARKNKKSGTILNKLFKDSITNAKIIKTKTSLSNIPTSISTLTVKFILDKFENLNNKTILIIGTGAVATLLIKNLRKYKIKNLYVVTRKTKECLSDDFYNCKFINYNNRYNLVNESDVIISATSSPHYTITKDLMDENIKSKKYRMVMDLAVPRDIDSKISEIENTEYLNIDHFESISKVNNEKKYDEIKKADKYMDEALYDFERWYEFRKFTPVLQEAQQYISEIVTKKTEFISGSLNIKDIKEKEKIKIGVESTVKEIVNKFVFNLKDNGSKEDINNYFTIMRDLFKSQ
jgi:glutamyl-tRNA reductase